MRDYAKVMTRFWSDGSGKAIRDDDEARLLAMYLFTNEHSNMYGLYRLALPTITHELGAQWPAERILKTIETLSKHDIAHYDPTRDLVWLPAGAETQVGASMKPTDNKRNGIAKRLERFAQHKFWHAFAARYGDAYHLNNDLTPRAPGGNSPDIGNSGKSPPAAEGASKGLRRGFEPVPEAPCEPHRRGSRSEAETEAEERAKGLPPKSRPRLAERRPPEESRSRDEERVLAHLKSHRVLHDAATPEMAQDLWAAGSMTRFKPIAEVLADIDAVARKAKAAKHAGRLFDIHERLLTFVDRPRLRKVGPEEVGTDPMTESDVDAWYAKHTGGA